MNFLNSIDSYVKLLLFPSISDYHVCHQVRNRFNAFQKTNVSENEYPYLYTDYDLPLVGLLNCPILSYHFHFSRIWQNVPWNFSINFHGNWVQAYIVFMFLEILCSLNQMVPEMKKKPIWIQGKAYSKCNMFLFLRGVWLVFFFFFLSFFFFNQKSCYLLNIFPVQHNENIIPPFFLLFSG